MFCLSFHFHPCCSFSCSDTTSHTLPTPFSVPLPHSARNLSGLPAPKPFLLHSTLFGAVRGARLAFALTGSCWCSEFFNGPRSGFYSTLRSVPRTAPVPFWPCLGIRGMCQLEPVTPIQECSWVSLCTQGLHLCSCTGPGSGRSKQISPPAFPTASPISPPPSSHIPSSPSCWAFFVF